MKSWLRKWRDRLRMSRSELRNAYCIGKGEHWLARLPNRTPHPSSLVTQIRENVRGSSVLICRVCGAVRIRAPDLPS